MYIDLIDKIWLVKTVWECLEKKLQCIFITEANLNLNCVMFLKSRKSMRECMYAHV